MNINTSSLLSFLEPKLTASSKSKIQSLSIDGKIDLSKVLGDKSLQTLINSLFKDILSGVKTKSNVNQLLQNSKAMLNLSNVANDVKDILSQIKDNPKLAKQSTVLREFLIDIKNINNKSLKSNISNSGVFLESKLLKNDLNVSNDLKAVLGQIAEHIDEPKIQKTIEQIQYNQLLSYTSYSNNTFLPFIWDNIEDGSISLSSNEKEQFTCNIELNLKNYGMFKAMLLLEKKDNLHITMRIKDKNFKDKIQDNLQILRQKLKSISLNLQSLNVLDIVEHKDKENFQKAYENDDKLNYGVDIKA